MCIYDAYRLQTACGIVKWLQKEDFFLYRFLKCPYYGILKITFHAVLMPETHCTIFGCPRRKTGIVKQSRRFLIGHDSNLSSGTAENRAVCLGLNTALSE